MVKNRFVLTPYFLDQYSASLEDLCEADWMVIRAELPPGGKLARMAALFPGLAQRVKEIVQAGERPVSIAGDCCTAIAVLAGIRGAGLEPALIWLDAHGDFNTWETTPSGFLGGMPLAMLVGRGEQTLAEVVGLAPYPEHKVLLYDGRELDAGEKLALAGSRVTRPGNLQELLDHPLTQGPLYVHFDTDLVDPGEAPAMAYPAPGGSSAEEVRAVFQELRRRGQVCAVSLSTWRPDMDGDGRTRRVCMDLLGELVGSQ